MYGMRRKRHDEKTWGVPPHQIKTEKSPLKCKRMGTRWRRQIVLIHKVQLGLGKPSHETLNSAFLYIYKYIIPTVLPPVFLISYLIQANIHLHLYTVQKHKTNLNLVKYFKVLYILYILRNTSRFFPGLMVINKQGLKFFNTSHIGFKKYFSRI